MDDNEEGVQKEKISKIALISYFIVGLFIVFFIISPFMSPKHEMKIDILVSQNVEENLNITCKTYYCENVDERNLLIQKYKSSDIIIYMTAPKDKRCSIFIECIGGKYMKSKYAPVDLNTNEVKMEIEILENKTEKT